MQTVPPAPKTCERLKRAIGIQIKAAWPPLWGNQMFPGELCFYNPDYKTVEVFQCRLIERAAFPACMFSPSEVSRHRHLFDVSDV